MQSAFISSAIALVFGVLLCSCSAVARHERFTTSQNLAQAESRVAALAHSKERRFGLTQDAIQSGRSVTSRGRVRYKLWYWAPDIGAQSPTSYVELRSDFTKGTLIDVVEYLGGRKVGLFDDMPAAFPEANREVLSPFDLNDKAHWQGTELIIPDSL
jgi:hypothetical protein